MFPYSFQEMKLIHSVTIGFALGAPFESNDEAGPYASDFGIYPVECEEYFVGGAAWPLATGNKAKAGRVVKLCQNQYQKPHYYASLYSVDDRIPVYSGGTRLG